MLFKGTSWSHVNFLEYKGPMCNPLGHKLPDLRCHVCRPLLVIESSSPEHNCLSAVQLRPLQCSPLLPPFSCMLCCIPCLLPPN